MSLTINEKAPSWHQCEFTRGFHGVASKAVSGITAVSWGRKKVLTNNYGAGQDPVHQTVGSKQYDESKLTFYKDEWADIKTELGDEDWMGHAFQLVIKYRFEKPDGTTGPLLTTTIDGSLGGEAESLSVDDKAITQDVTFLPISIKTGSTT